MLSGQPTRTLNCVRLALGVPLQQFDCFLLAFPLGHKLHSTDSVQLFWLQPLRKQHHMTAVQMVS